MHIYLGTKEKDGRAVTIQELAGWDHARRDGTHGTAGETVRVSAGSSGSFGEIFGRAGSGGQMETPDRDGTGGGQPIHDTARHRRGYSTLADRFHGDSGSNCTGSIAAGTLPARPELLCTLPDYVG